MQKKYRRAKLACYFGNITMSAVSTLSPILFVTFHQEYKISYTLLGLLAVFCFGIQLSVDLIFSFFASHFDVHKTVRTTPILAFAGMLIYAVLPPLFPKQFAYLFLVIGTLLFSVSAGLCEVLLSPIIAAIPSDNPEREMSKLHSIYAWGVVGVVVVSTLLLKLVTPKYWFFMAGFWCIVPFIDFILFMTAELPPVSSGAGEGRKRGIPKGILLCFVCIFMGGASEVIMTQWCSSFLERALNIPKTVGDIFGLALFAALLGLGRTLYSKFGKNIYRTLLFGMIGALVCYLLAALSPFPILALFGCICTGFCVSMLWPGTLIYMEEKHPNPGVVPFALMAAGGDAGASLGPQAVGLIVDGVKAAVEKIPRLSELAARYSLTPAAFGEQLGMKGAMLFSALFPLIGCAILIVMKIYYAKRKQKQ